MPFWPKEQADLRRQLNAARDALKEQQAAHTMVWCVKEQQERGYALQAEAQQQARALDELREQR
eukprot:gene33251-23157_t